MVKTRALRYAAFFVSLLLLAVVLFLILRSPENRKGAALDALTADSGRIAEIRKDRVQTDGLLTGLYLNGFEAPRAGNVFYYSMAEDAADPYHPAVSAAGDGVSLLFLRTETDGDFLRSGAGVPFIAYTDTEWAEYTLQFTTLPVISVEVREPDANGGYDVTTKDDRLMRLTLFDNRAGVAEKDRTVTSAGLIRVRGSSSATLPKKSYRVSLKTVSPGKNYRNNHQSLLGMRADDDWILYSCAGDRDHLRNIFSQELWADTCRADNGRGTDMGLRGAYVEVLMNGEYLGLYSLTCPLDDKQLGLRAGDDYYRGSSYVHTDAEMLDTADDRETGVGAWEYRGAKKTPSAGRWKALAGYYHAVYDGMDTLLDWTAAYTDTDNLIDYYLFCTLLNAKDNFQKNLNLVFFRNEEKTTCLFLPWDLDLTWGNRLDLDEEWHIKAEDSAPDDPFLARALLVPALRKNDSGINDAFIARWRELRAGEWSDSAMMKRLDRYETALFDSGAMAREAARWPTAALSENLDGFREYALARLAWLDSAIEEVP